MDDYKKLRINLAELKIHEKEATQYLTSLNAEVGAQFN